MISVHARRGYTAALLTSTSIPPSSATVRRIAASDGLTIGDVGVERKCTPASVRHLARNLLGSAGDDVDTADRGAGGGKGDTDALAQTAAGAGHDRDPTLQREGSGAQVPTAASSTSFGETALPSSAAR